MVQGLGQDRRRAWLAKKSLPTNPPEASLPGNGRRSQGKRERHYSAIFFNETHPKE